jgi:hypothetical protein
MSVTGLNRPNTIENRLMMFLIILNMLLHINKNVTIKVKVKLSLCFN